MSLTYTVAQVAPETREFETQYGPMVSYMVQFAGSDEWIEIARKATSAPPVVGQSLAGKISDAPKPGLPRKFKVEFTGGGLGGSGRAPRDPREIAQIQRQHSQEMSWRAMQFAAAQGVDVLTVEGEQVMKQYLGVAARLTDWHDRDIAQGAQKAINAGSYGKVAEPKNAVPMPTGQSDVPTPQGFEPVPSGVAAANGDDVPF